ncbi:MAG: hypothetical protein AAF721_25665 [Myxococcota bacterium]
MKGFWKGLDARRRRGVVAALVFMGLAQAACVPQLWAALEDDTAQDGSGQRSVMMLENRHSALRDYEPAPVAGSLEVSVQGTELGAPTVALAYRDHWREELARATGDVGENGRISIDLEQETEAPRPWWRCRSFEDTTCTAYAVELKTLRVEATLADDGVLVVHSLVAGTAHVIRERASGRQHDDAARWTRYELPDEVEIELDPEAAPIS